MSTVDDVARTTTRTRTSTAQKVGLILAGLLCLANLPSAFVPGSAPDEVGPPTEVLLACTVLAAVGLVAIVPAWRSAHPVALRVLAACLVVMTLTAVPGLFVPVPPVVKIGVAAAVLVTVATVVLLFRRDRSAGRA